MGHLVLSSDSHRRPQAAELTSFPRLVLSIRVRVRAHCLRSIVAAGHAQWHGRSGMQLQRLKLWVSLLTASCEERMFTRLSHGQPHTGICSCLFSYSAKIRYMDRNSTTYSYCLIYTRKPSQSCPHSLAVYHFATKWNTCN